MKCSVLAGFGTNSLCGMRTMEHTCRTQPAAKQGYGDVFTISTEHHNSLHTYTLLSDAFAGRMPVL